MSSSDDDDVPHLYVSHASNMPKCSKSSSSTAVGEVPAAHQRQSISLSQYRERQGKSVQHFSKEKLQQKHTQCTQPPSTTKQSSKTRESLQNTRVSGKFVKVGKKSSPQKLRRSAQSQVEFLASPKAKQYAT